MEEKIFVEYGLDFDNNRFGFGRSVEIEKPDGTESRETERIKLKNKSYYFRFWIFRRVFVVSKKGFEIVKKKRNNLKIVLGVSGKRI